MIKKLININYQTQFFISTDQIDSCDRDDRIISC